MFKSKKSKIISLAVPGTKMFYYQTATLPWYSRLTTHVSRPPDDGSRMTVYDRYITPSPHFCLLLIANCLFLTVLFYPPKPLLAKADGLTFLLSHLSAEASFGEGGLCNCLTK